VWPSKERIYCLRIWDSCQNTEADLSMMRWSVNACQVVESSLSSKGSFTCWPVQNVGHLSHGTFLASGSQALRYGFRTIKGRTGGVSVEARDLLKRTAKPAITAVFNRLIGLMSKGKSYESYERRDRTVNATKIFSRSTRGLIVHMEYHQHQTCNKKVGASQVGRSNNRVHLKPRPLSRSNVRKSGVAQ
jgi:hypothetical protein